MIERIPLHVAGWALEGKKPVAGVSLVLNETTIIPCRLGVTRPDVPANLGEPDAEPACGWEATIDLAAVPPGDLRIRAIAAGSSGVECLLAERFYTLPRVVHTPVWTWELPDSLGVTSDQLIREISPDERMEWDDRDVYYSVGLSALKAIRLAALAAGKSSFDSILDMPSGHGRVLRWLKAAYPDARLTACDLLTDGVDYCAQTFGATPVYSSPYPTAAAFPDRYDLIFVGSLLTHVDAHHWDHLIALWHGLLTPDGLLVVTTHGDLAAARMRGGDLYGYPHPSIVRALATYDRAGFCFLAEPEKTDYGITLARPEWTLARLGRHPDFRVVLYSEALWAQHQDVAAVVRRPLLAGPDPTSPR